MKTDLGLAAPRRILLRGAADGAVAGCLALLGPVLLWRTVHPWLGDLGSTLGLGHAVTYLLGAALFGGVLAWRRSEPRLALTVAAAGIGFAGIFLFVLLIGDNYLLFPVLLLVYAVAYPASGLALALAVPRGAWGSLLAWVVAGWAASIAVGFLATLVTPDLLALVLPDDSTDSFSTLAEPGWTLFALAAFYPLYAPGILPVFGTVYGAGTLAVVHSESDDA